MPRGGGGRGDTLGHFNAWSEKFGDQRFYLYRFRKCADTLILMLVKRPHGEFMCINMPFKFCSNDIKFILCAHYLPGYFFFHCQKYLQEQQRIYYLLKHIPLQLQNSYVMFESPSVFGAEHSVIVCLKASQSMNHDVSSVTDHDQAVTSRNITQLTDYDNTGRPFKWSKVAVLIFITRGQLFLKILR